MKSVLKLMKRFFLILLCSGLILLVLNLGLLIYLTYGSVSNAGGWTSTSELTGELQELSLIHILVSSWILVSARRFKFPPLISFNTC